MNWCLLGLVALLVIGASDASTCVSMNTLTSSCENLCYTGRPCIAFASGTTCGTTPLNSCVNSTITNCTFSCLKYGTDDFILNNIIDYTKFIFLIPYAGYISRWESNWDNDDKTAASIQSFSNDTTLYPSLNDAILDAIAPLQFRPSMKALTIVGGSSVIGGVRGRVVDVKMAPSVLIDQTNLQSVTLANIQLEQIPLNSFPSQLLNLTIRNGVLTQVPNDLEKLTQLQQLDLSKNYLTTYPAKFSGLNQLQVLNLSQNSLEKFESNNGFQALVSLDLSDNLISIIPPSIFSLSTLRSLDLRKNSFSNLQFTQDQVTFLNQIPSFQIDAVGLSTSCSEKTTLGSIQVCIGSPNGNGSTSSTAIAAWVGGSVGAVILILLILFLYRRHRRPKFHTKSKYKSNTRSDLGDFSSADGVGSLWNDQELLSLQVNAAEIQDIRKLGAGAFCIVYLAKYRNTRYVASKRLKRDELNQKNIKLFIQEIKLVSTLDHPRIVALVGVAWTIEADLQALFEYMENGDVRSYLENPSTPRYWTNEKLQIVIDAIEGLVYVHSFALPIIHRDLKSRNVLLDGQYRAKLCDFGVARYRSDGNHTMTTGVGTGRWLAPEVISGSSDYDQACDIFSFGVVLSEMDTHTLPYEDVRGPNGNQIADVALLQMVASGKIVPSFSRQCPPDLYQLALRCLSLHAKDRPTAIEIAYTLRTMQHHYL